MVPNKDNPKKQLDALLPLKVLKDHLEEVNKTLVNMLRVNEMREADKHFIEISVRIIQQVLNKIGIPQEKDHFTAPEQGLMEKKMRLIEQILNFKGRVLKNESLTEVKNLEEALTKLTKP